MLMHARPGRLEPFVAFFRAAGCFGATEVGHGCGAASGKCPGRARASPNAEGKAADAAQSH